MTKDQVLEAIRRCARKLGRNPTRDDLAKMARITRRELDPHYTLLAQAIHEAGLRVNGKGFSRDNLTLLKDWAGVVRKLNAIPSASQYQRQGTYSPNTLVYRFRRWRRVPEMFVEFVRANENETEWADVVKIIEDEKERVEKEAAGACYTGGPLGGSSSGAATESGREAQGRVLLRVPAENPKPLSVKNFEDRPMYGTPLWLPGMAHEPTNEYGVIFVFALLAWRMGFVVERLQATFPDCEALRQVSPGRWQRVSIEFEYESRNFEKHGHKAGDCDLIVCWVHNWQECPQTIEVMELRKEIG